MTSAQCQHARSLVGWSKKQLAEAADISFSTIHRFEDRGALPNSRLLVDIQQALEAAGVEFIAENSGGPGVRLRNRQDADHQN